MKNSLSKSLIKPKALDSLVLAIGEDNAKRVVDILQLQSLSDETKAHFEFLSETFMLTDLRTGEVISQENFDDKIPLNISSDSMIDKPLPVLVEAHVGIEKPRANGENAKTLKKMKPGGFITLLQVINRDHANQENKYKFSYIYGKKKRIITLSHTHFELILSKALKPSLSYRLFLDGGNPEVREILREAA